GCGGSGGQSEPVEQLVRQTFSEDCLLCHRPGSIRDVAEVHSIETNSPAVSIIAVREVDLGGGDVRLEVDVKIVDSANPLIPVYIDPTDTGSTGQLRNLRFTLAKLVPGIGADMNWQSYINSAGAPLRATSERANVGVFSALTTPGEYRYRLSFNMNAVKDPVSGADITYGRANTHRIATQFPDNVNNAFVDFVPNSLPLASPFPVPAVNRKISANASCNQCHVRLGFHGGDRKSLEYCVTCHNPGSTDPTSGNTVDFKVMIHKIHRGEDLPGGNYTLGRADYSTVVYPQDIRNCTKCHDGVDADTPEGDNWKDVPTTASCTSCHNDPGTFPGFPNLTVQQIMDSHTIAEQVAAQSIQFNILNISTTAGTAGALDVTIQFSITDPTNANMPYDITDTTTTDFTGLSFRIGWNTADYNNTDSGTPPAQPLTVSVGDATDTGNFIYTVTANDAIPADVTGSGIVALQGRPVRDLDGDGGVDDRVPATSVARSFAITDAVAQNRRLIVDTANCNKCHGLLSAHGSNRNNNTQVCVICHNANATDVDFRPADPTTTADGKAEETIDFKHMIHAIHAGDKDMNGFRENGIVVYGYGSRANDFSHVRFPGILQNCEACHLSGTFELPIDENVQPTTVNVGDDPEDPDDDREITPVASVCSSCHDSIFSRTHMAENGGNFDFMLFKAEAEGEGSGTGGPSGEQPPGHTTRTDCSSCHGSQ
ncbi:MAG: OmcA/MtrC family decaheme c-type cytochrome, partial [Chloroflexota bacterium]